MVEDTFKVAPLRKSFIVRARFRNTDCFSIRDSLGEDGRSDQTEDPFKVGLICLCPRVQASDRRAEAKQKRVSGKCPLTLFLCSHHYKNPRHQLRPLKNPSTGISRPDCGKFCRLTVVPHPGRAYHGSKRVVAHVNPLQKKLDATQVQCIREVQQCWSFPEKRMKAS